MDAGNTIKYFDQTTGAELILNGGVLVPGTGGGGGNAVTVPVGQGGQQTITGTTAAETFNFDAVQARATAANTQVRIDSFTTANDVLQLNLPIATGATTLAAFVAGSIQGVTATVVQLGDGAGSLVNFGPDGNADAAVTVLLAGVFDPASVMINVI